MDAGKAIDNNPTLSLTKCFVFHPKHKEALFKSSQVHRLRSKLPQKLHQEIPFTYTQVTLTQTVLCNQFDLSKKELLFI